MESVTPMSKAIAHECRFAFYQKDNWGEGDVLHVVKELIHYEDGSKKKNLRFIKNMERPFWVVKPALRKYTQRREWMAKEDLIEFSSTQSSLIRSAARALGQPWFQGSLRQLNNNPYLFGTDITSTAYLKSRYLQKYPDQFTAYEYAVYDFETNIFTDRGEVMMATVAIGKKSYTWVRRAFFKGRVQIEEELDRVIRQQLSDIPNYGDLFTKFGLEFEVILVDTPWDVVSQSIQKLHELQPDFVGVWNLPFEIKKIQETCEDHGQDIADLMCDPRVPKRFRSYRFKEGEAKRVTASGRVMTFKPSDRWNTVYAPASFYWMDSMCCYRRAREGGKELPSYSLDAILKEELGITKLKFSGADHIEDKTAWHFYMQEHHPFEYVAYNIFDCVSMLILDAKTMDLAVAIPMAAECSDFDKMNSQPRRMVDSLTMDGNADGWVMGTTAEKEHMVTDVHRAMPSVDGWIIAQATELIAPKGLKILEDLPDQPTNVYINCVDLDISKAYPTNGEVANSSLETTRKVLSGIPGVDEWTVRKNSLNLSGGAVNAGEFCTELLGLPTMLEMGELFEKSLG